MLTVRSVRGREAVGQLYEYVVIAEVEDLDLLLDPLDAAQVDLEKIVGTSGTVAIEVTGIGTFRPGQRGYSGYANRGADTRYISGQITSARIICAENRCAIYEFVLRPAVWRATQNKNSRIFRGSVDEVLRKILMPYGTTEWRIAGPSGGKGYYPPRDFLRQAWESDWSIAMRLMEEWGLFFWFEHDKDGHTLVVSDALSGFHRHGVAYETLRYHTGGRIDEEHIDELSVTYSLTAGKATVNDHDYMQPRLRRANAALREEFVDAHGTASAGIEIYAPAEFAQPETDPPLTDRNDLRQEGLHLARVKLQAVRCASLRVHGKGRLRGLQPGRTFRLVNYPQRSANQEYIVLSSELELTEVGTSSGSWRQYSVDTQFELQPSTEIYRMPQSTPRPHVDDEYAVIVTPEHHKNEHYEVWVDDKNRVLIQYDWDRQAQFDGATSVWLRLATQWQGSQMGVVTPARAGQMVIVSHVHGDPDRPYVSAFVVDRWNMPPWEMPRNSALSGLRSQSLGESSDSNHIALDDTHGRLQAQLASDHAKSSLTLGFNTRIDGNKGRQEARGQGFELRTDGHGVARAAKGLLLTTEARENARGHALDMGETIAKLTQAHGIHESLFDVAQQHCAQNAVDDQRAVARAIETANEAIRGRSDLDAGQGQFPEFEAPHLTLSSPVGIQSTTGGSTHISSGEDLAVTSGRHVSFAVARSVFASVVESVAVFVQKAGIALTAAAGKIRLEAQRDGVQLIAKKDVQIISTGDGIDITAAKRIRLNAGGTMLEISPDGLLGFTNGQFLVHAATHGTEGPHEKPVKTPLTNIDDAKVAEPFILIDPIAGFGIPNQPYRIVLDDGTLLEGRTNDAGETALVLSDSVQRATIEILHNDGTNNPSSVLSAMLVQSADAHVPEVSSQKKRETTKVNDRELQARDETTSSAGKSPYFALCEPYNWGMRYSEKDRKDARRLAYPVAERFAKEMAQALIEQVQWGSNYFGKEKPTLYAKLIDGSNCLSDQTCQKLAKVISLSVRNALTAMQSGNFALPEQAFPTITVTNDTLVGNAKGTFDPAHWTLSINTDPFSPLFAPCAVTDQSQRETQARVVLKNLVDTVFHETRHCQQDFWIYALVQQRAADFPDTPNIRQWPAQASQFSELANAVVRASASQVLPDDNANLLGIKQMAVAKYVWNLHAFTVAKWYPTYASDPVSLREEYDRARKQAETLLGSAGADRSAIDVDDMVVDSGYQSRPWEDDAFVCGEIESSYWSSDRAPDDMVVNQCSRKYALSYNSRRATKAATSAGVSGNASRNGG
ncbi:type VI secretion system Vgr family protein [Caballeronia sp. GAFFF1]|uniref:type VI secretion system Vgr family protein n=1 Tax=Caballeronia sp. GAFFF1 TaxID=2921779 RepID=UPI00202987A5|nr:type VI secretion system Vgr family protein [Caballeronia sp. GAFFF1]